MNIAVAGTGYVGLSLATLLAQHHHVTAVDVVPEKVERINRGQSPIQDEYIEAYLAEKKIPTPKSKAWTAGTSSRGYAWTVYTRDLFRRD